MLCTKVAWWRFFQLSELKLQLWEDVSVETSNMELGNSEYKWNTLLGVVILIRKYF